MSMRPGPGVRLSIVVAMMATSAAAAAETITLDEASRLAAKQHSDIKVAEADVEVLGGEVSAADTFAYNPEIDVALGPSFGGSQTSFDFEVSLSQAFELGGKRGKRVQAAEARRRAAALRVDWTRRQVAVRVKRAFYLAVVAKERLTTTAEVQTITDEQLADAKERLRLGGGTQLEVNVASAAAGRARSERLAAEREYGLAKAELALAVAAPVGADLEPDGGLPAAEALAADEDAYVKRALAARRDLDATAADRLAAEADVRVADAIGSPDAALGISYAREGLDDSHTILAGFTITLPVWNRNRGGRFAARARLTKARATEDGARREAERTARASYQAYALAREAVLGFDKDVVEKLGENLTLAAESFRAGKIGRVEFNLVRRDLVDTRRAYLDALVDLVESRYSLELSAGGEVQ